MRKLTPEELKARQGSSDRRIMPVALLLEKIRSMYNVGSFFRTGDGAGVEKVFISGWTASPPRKEISKVALGAEEVVPFEKVAQDAAQAAETIRSQGYHLIAVEHTSTSRNLYDFDLPFPCCLVFGHEVEGISPPLLAQCEAAVEVPMYGVKESLNVAVCAGAVLFEARRQWEAGKG